MPDQPIETELRPIEIDAAADIDALNADGNESVKAEERPLSDDLSKQGVLPEAEVAVAPGLQNGEKVELDGKTWTAKGQFEGKSILFNEEFKNHLGEFKILPPGSKPDLLQYKELPRFENQAPDTQYFTDKSGQVFKLTKGENGSSVLSTAGELKLVANEALPKAESSPPAVAARAELPKVSEEIDYKGEKLKLAAYEGEHALLHKTGRNANSAVAAEPISETDLSSKYQEIKVQIDGKEESRYIEKGHPEKGVYTVTDLGGQKVISKDAAFEVVAKSELSPAPEVQAPGKEGVKEYDPAEKMDLERIKKIAAQFSESTREIPITREQFESIFKNLSEADRKIALEIMEQSAPNMTPRALDEQLRSLQSQLDKIDPALRKEGITVFTLKGDDTGAMMAQLLRKNQDQLKVNVIELDEAGMKELKAKGVPEKALVLGDLSQATQAQREMLGSVKKLYVSDINGFDRGLNLIDFGASQFAGPQAMQEKLAGLVEQAKALQAADSNLSTQEAVRRIMQGETAKRAAEINAESKVLQPELKLPGKELRDQVGGNSEYRINSMYEQLTAPQITAKQMEQYLASIGSKEIQSLTGHILENGGIEYKSYTQMMKEYRELHNQIMAKMPPGTKPQDVLIVSGLERQGSLAMGKPPIDNVGSQLVAGKLYAIANGLGPENFISAAELAARGPGAAKGKVLLYVDDFALSGRQAAGVMHQNSEMLKASEGKVVVATLGRYETPVDAWNLWRTDPKRYGGLQGLDLTVASNKVYKNFYSPEYLESLGLKGRETQLGRFNMFKPGHDSGISTYLLTPYGGPNNNLQMLDDMSKQTGLRGKSKFKLQFDQTAAIRDLPAPPPPAETRPERVVPNAGSLQATETKPNTDGSIDRREAKPGEVLAREQLERRDKVDAREIESMRRQAEELAKSEKQADKEKADALRRTIDALEGKLGREAEIAAHRTVLEESRKALERGEGGGYGRAVVGGLIGIGILVGAALAYYNASLKAEEQRALERAKVR